MATPLFIFSKSKEGLATWTIWGVPTPPRSTNPLLYIYILYRNWKLGVARHWVISDVLEFCFLSSFLQNIFSHISLHLYCNCNWYFWTWVLSFSSWILQQSRSFFVDPKTWQVDAILGSFFKFLPFVLGYRKRCPSPTLTAMETMKWSIPMHWIPAKLWNGSHSRRGREFDDKPLPELSNILFKSNLINRYIIFTLYI